MSKLCCSSVKEVVRQLTDVELGRIEKIMLKHSSINNMTSDELKELLVAVVDMYQLYEGQSKHIKKYSDQLFELLEDLFK